MLVSCTVEYALNGHILLWIWSPQIKPKKKKNYVKTIKSTKEATQTKEVKYQAVKPKNKLKQMLCVWCDLQIYKLHSLTS